MLEKTLNSKVAQVAFFLLDDFEKTDFTGICTQMSFYLLLAFFPLLVFLISFIGQFIASFEALLDNLLREFLPSLSYDYVANLLNRLTHHGSSSSQYFLILISFFFATLAVRAIMIGLNQTYGQEEARSYLKIWGLSLIFTFLLAIVIIIIIVTSFVSIDIGVFILNQIGLSENATDIVQVFTILFSWIISTLLFNFIYTKAPVNRLKFTSGLPGSFFAFLSLTVAFRIFAFFINNSSKYTTLYGSLGGLFALLIALYFISVIINLGGKINLYWSLYRSDQLKQRIFKENPAQDKINYFL